MTEENSSIHLTYQKIDRPDEDLRQGDIIQPTEGIRKIFHSVHPHFVDDKYIAFMVLTQTCDLVRRAPHSCKSRYINLAVVRPLQNVLLPLLDRICTSVVIKGVQLDGIFQSESKYEAIKLIGKIVNQNAQAEGLFYLHPDPAIQIGEPSVALLQVNVAVRAAEHYCTVVEARTGRLADSFQSKLGWLLGNLYSRVATQDISNKLKTQITDQFLDPDNQGYPTDTPYWTSKSVVQIISQSTDLTGDQLLQMDREKLIKLLSETKTPSTIEKAVDRIKNVLSEPDLQISDENVTKISHRLKNDQLFSSILRQALK